MTGTLLRGAFCCVLICVYLVSPSRGALFGIAYDATTQQHELRSIDPAVGQTDLLSRMTFDSGSWNAATLSSDPFSNRVYAVSSAGTLYTFDGTAGSLQGTQPLGASMQALGILRSLDLGAVSFATATQSHALHWVDPVTGQTIVRDPFVFDSGAWSSATFTSSLFSDEAYALSSIGTLYLFDPQNGSTDTDPTKQIPMQALGQTGYGLLIGIAYNAATQQNEIYAMNPFSSAGDATMLLNRFTFDSGGWEPNTLTTNPLTNRGYMQSSAGTLYEFDLTTGTILSTQSLDTTLQALIDTLPIDGDNRIQDQGERVQIGYQAEGRIEVIQGGRLRYDNVTLGGLPTGSGTMDVRDANSLLRVLNTLKIGGLGEGSVEIQDRAELVADFTYLGETPGSRGTVSVSDGGRLTAFENLDIGYGGSGILRVEEANLVSANGRLGQLATGFGMVSLSGANALWVASGPLDVGIQGTGVLDVNEGANLFTEEARLGRDATGRGSVTLASPESGWRVRGDLTIGDAGRGSLDLSDGSHVESVTGYIGRAAGGVGSVSLAGDTTQWMNGNLYVGDEGGGTLTSVDGARVFAREVFLGYGVGGTGDVTLSGSSSASASRDVFVGYLGRGTLSLGGGASFRAGSASKTQQITLGYDTAGDGALSIEGEGTTVESGTLTIGDAGTGHLSIAAGGVLENRTGLMGDRLGSVGTGLVSGPQSRWQLQSSVIGYEGQGTLTISDGAKVESTVTGIGYEPGGLGTVNVTGTGAALNAPGWLVVGLAGEGRLNVADGGQVTAGYAGIGFGDTRPSTWPSTFPSAPAPPFYPSQSATTLTQSPGLLDIGSDGRLTAPVLDIWTYGTLRGDGTVVSQALNNHGLIQPGHSIGTMNIDGNLRFETGSVLEVEVDNSGASDRLEVSGDVTIGGGTVKAISTETLTGAHDYTLINAARVTGAFETLDTALLDVQVVENQHLESSTGLNYSDTRVGLSVTAVRFDDPSVARQGNERYIGSILQEIAFQGGNDLTTAIQGLGSRAAVRAAYGELGARSRPSLGPITGAGSTRLLGAVTGRIESIRGAFSRHLAGGSFWAMAGPSEQPLSGLEHAAPSLSVGRGAPVLAGEDWGLWAKGYGVFGDRDATGSGMGYDYRVGGLGTGVDYRLTDRFTGGLTAGLSETEVAYDGVPDHSDIEGTTLGLYGSYRGDGWYGDAILSYADLDYHTDRFVSLSAEHLRGDFGGSEMTGYLEAGIHLQRARGWVAQPLASLQVSHLRLDGYTEQGGASALGFSTQEYTSVQGGLGAKATKMFRLTDRYNGSLQFRGRWVHAFGDSESRVSAYFTSLPGTTFDVVDQASDRDRIVLGTSLYAPVSRHGKLLLDYDIRIGSDESAHHISGACQFRR